ncbi:major facilitator superfamily domain-containing protein 12-like [Stylophora pistillata]|uniref:Major facilitator superfamily domain-containing protein 12 n=1 Tax=Stylophora pistillata TaxID=50429 RepID=A0A2B4SG73_STYPI|nr:major facilitator superfamily domain-containing protein 12-like [Stylophora pistillata]PFX27557.1 Major facilitator superfamily domain-containing protein 12 [Stylophora pistillata]
MNRLANFFHSKRSQEKVFKGNRLAVSQKFCYGVGHILNDLAANTWYSYLIIYLTKVVRLSNSHTGLVVLLGQVTDGVCTPIIAILNDRTVCRYGRRKIWHVVGSICVSFSFPLLFTRLIGDEASASLKLAYYIGIAALFQFGWGCVQISHLSLIPEIAISESEKVELNAISSALRFICGIFVFCVTWILLGRSSEANISSSMWQQFMYLGFIIVGTGTVCNIVFHVGIKEPPSDALLKWLEERKNGNHKFRRRGTEKKGLLVRAVYPPPFPSRRSGASPAVVMTLQEKEKKKAADHSEGTECPVCLENEETRRSTLNITDKTAILGGGKSKRQWMTSPEMYKIGFVYICTRLYVNVSQSYLPLYLTETMRFEKESIAYFPLVVLVTGVFASTAVKPLNKRLGSKITFCLGAMMAVSASFWFFVQTIDARTAVYATSMLMGSGGSVMLVTSFSLIAQLIGQDKRSGAFVYGFIGFFDKVFSGAVFAVIQQLNPRKDQRAECFTCDEYTRHVQSIVPGAVALLALVSVMMFFESIFVCKKRASTTDAAVQVDFDEILGDGDTSSSGVETSSMTEKDDSEACNLDSVEKGACAMQNRTFDCSIESRNFHPKKTTMQSYVAMRLASASPPSPMLDRRTIL